MLPLTLADFISESVKKVLRSHGLVLKNTLFIRNCKYCFNSVYGMSFRENIVVTKRYPRLTASAKL